MVSEQLKTIIIFNGSKKGRQIDSLFLIISIFIKQISRSFVESLDE